MNKKIVIFILVYTFIFSGFVAYKYIYNSSFVLLNKNYTLGMGEVVKFKDKNYTVVKLQSIDRATSCDQNTMCNGLIFRVLINNKEYTVSSLPGKIELYKNNELIFVDGDEDRLTIKMIEK